jgi:acetyl esterase/lipase
MQMIVESTPMKSKHLIDHELLKAFHGEPPIVKINAENRAQANQFFIGFSKRFNDPNARPIKVSKKTIAGPKSQEITVLVYQPEEQQKSPRPGVLHMHGGGFVIGSAEMNEGFCKKMASDLGSVVVSVDYTLAPEAHFPLALEECYSALLWMKRDAEQLGIDPNRLAITGESAWIEPSICSALNSSSSRTSIISLEDIFLLLFFADKKSHVSSE